MLLLETESVTEPLLNSDTVEYSLDDDDNGEEGHDSGDEVFILWLWICLKISCESSIMFCSIPLNAGSISLFICEGGVEESVRVVPFTPSTMLLRSSLFEVELPKHDPVILPPSPLSCDDGESSPPLATSCEVGAFAARIRLGILNYH